MKRVPLTIFCAALFAAAATHAAAESRTWTSAADPTKTFEGELIAVSETDITVRRADGQTMTFPLTVVSEADQKFAKEKAADLPSPDEAAGGPVPRELAGAVTGGGSLGTAEYFIIWCAANR